MLSTNNLSTEHSTSFSTTTLVAPASIALVTKSWPSTVAPGIATKVSPGLTFLESILILIV